MFIYVIVDGISSENDGIRVYAKSRFAYGTTCSDWTNLTNLMMILTDSDMDSPSCDEIPINNIIQNYSRVV